MITDDSLLGIQKTNPSLQRELKVKLPVEYLVRLHVIKLTENRGISDVVSVALDEFFKEAGVRAAAARASASQAP